MPPFIRRSLVVLVSCATAVTTLAAQEPAPERRRGTGPCSAAAVTGVVLATGVFGATAGYAMGRFGVMTSAEATAARQRRGARIGFALGTLLSGAALLGDRHRCDQRKPD